MIIAIDGPSGAGSLRLPKRLPKSWVFLVWILAQCIVRLHGRLCRKGSALLTGRRLLKLRKITPLVLDTKKVILFQSEFL